MTFKIAIIGRPNVGKSTLFNKLAGKSLAIVDDFPGVTRDRREGYGNLGDMKFNIIDTAGLEYDLQENQLEKRMVDQTDIAISEADICLFLVDGKAGINKSDMYFANKLKNTNKNNNILVINKLENRDEEILEKEYYKLGFKNMVAISAEHKQGFADLYDAILPFYEKYQQDFVNDLDQDNNEDKIQIAVIGRPNAGKSTFLNSLIGQDRLITGPESGITRDSIAINWQFENYQIRLIDTAGIRRKSHINQKLETLSVADSFKAIRFAQIVIIIIDASLAEEKFNHQDFILDHQDMALAQLAVKEGRGIVFALNKFDKVKDQDKILNELRLQLSKSLPEISGSAILPVCAINNHNVDKVLQFAIKTYKQWQQYITTSKLNEWLQIAEAKHPPILIKGKSTRLKYITQSKKRPPTFTLFTNYPKAINDSYKRYLINFLKEYFDLKLTTIRLNIKKSDNPFADKKEKKFSKKRITGKKN